MEIDDIVAVLQGAKEGKRIEARPRNMGLGAPWYEVDVPSWDFSELDYRIKLEPSKPREFWVFPFHHEKVPHITHGATRHDNGSYGMGGAVHVREVLDENTSS